MQGGGMAVTMTMQGQVWPNGHGQNDHFDHDHNGIGITKWSWSNGQNCLSKIKNFANYNDRCSVALLNYYAGYWYI